MRITFMGRWMLAVTAGEAIGFMIPAAMGGIMALAAAPAWAVYPVMIAAGACEGALLGLGQTIGFGPSVVPRSWWVAATAAGAAVAWSIGMMPSTLPGFDPGVPGMLLGIVIGALLLLVSIPTLQWIVLRGVAAGSLRWVPINAGAWAAGILWTLAPSPFIDEKTPAPVLFASYVVAGLMMALTVAALTGPAARRIAMTAKDHDGIPASG